MTSPRQRFPWSQRLSGWLLGSFGPGNPDVRGHERFRRIGLTASGTALAKGIQLAATLVAVPLTVHFLGSERYGLWMTVTALIAVLGFADLGMGNGLLNAVAAANGRDDRLEAATAVSNAFFLLLAIAGAVALCFAALYPVVSWESVFNVTSPVAVAEAGPAVAVFVASFLLSLPLGIVQRTQLGYQEGLESNLWAAGGNLLGFLGLLLAIGVGTGLPGLMVGILSGPVVALAANSWHFYFRQRPWLRPSWRHVSLDGSRKLLTSGMLFFSLQLAVALCYQSPSFVIAHVINASAVTDYAVSLRLFSIAPMLLSFVLTPLWPAYGEAIARGDHRWVTQTFKRSIALGLLVNTPVAAFLVVFGADVMRLWVGPAAQSTLGLRLSFGVWAVLNSFGGPIAMLLNGANIVGFQVVCALLMGAAGLALSVLFVGQFGVAGAVLGTVIAQVVFNFGPALYFVPKLLTRIRAAESGHGTAPLPSQ